MSQFAVAAGVARYFHRHYFHLEADGSNAGTVVSDCGSDSCAASSVDEAAVISDAGRRVWVIVVVGNIKAVDVIFFAIEVIIELVVGDLTRIHPDVGGK